ncbi:MAG: DUF418 domain-containing protein [Phycisphaerae bacterium]|nr:DUF418 domain-containing protein [Phycisphaerae bacterium]
MRSVTAGAGLVAPVLPGERIQALDVLRGLALLGILVVNILDYSPRPTTTSERITAEFINVFADGSFYPLFSLLFGVGFAVFLDRAEARGANGVLLYLRRLVALLAIAVVQIVMLEDRNILVRYAFLALPLLLFWRASARACFFAALVLIGLAVARAPINRALSQRGMRDPVAVAAQRAGQASDRARNQARQAEQRRVAATHSFVATAAFRARWQVPTQLRWSANLRRNPNLLHILAMFLLGVAAWRSGMFLDPTKHRRLMGYVVVLGAVVGVAGNLAISLGPDGDAIPLLSGWPITTTAITFIANTALTLTYISAVVLLLSAGSEAWRRRLAPLALIGRMGLTNYLWQSVAMSLLFLPYGLRLEGKFPLWTYPLIAIVIFLSHLPLSAWWLARYRFGPVEWLWRTATYGRRQPMRLAPDAVSAVATS